MEIDGPLDVGFAGGRAIGVYLLRTAEGPALFDCGPASCLDGLEARLQERGVAITDLRHLLLSHIHLDHAGAAGVLVRRHPGLRVHVSGIGAPHLVDPSRLERSARRLYGDAFDDLWGELAPVPEANVEVVGERVVGLECFPTPGHAAHHVCYLTGEGTLLAGDATGVRIAPAAHVAPPCPPPDFDLDAWDATLDELERRAPARLALIHFGLFADVERHLDELRARLRDWAGVVEAGATEPEFVAAARAELPDAERRVYEDAMPFWQSYAGLRRWADKRAAAA